MIRKNIFIQLLAFILFLVGLSSCYEDKGNYDYIGLNDIEIKLEEFYIVNVGEEVRITPTLIFSQGKQTNELAYEWHWIEDKEKEPKSLAVLSEESFLTVSMTGELGRTGSYNIVLRIEDLVTGVFYLKNFKLRINDNPLLNGIVALCEKPDGFDLDMMALYGETAAQQKFILYKNVLTEVMDTEYPREGTPIMVFADPMTDPLAPYPGDTDNSRVKKNFFISTDKMTTRLKYEDFSYLPEYNITSITATNSGQTANRYFPNGVIAEKMFSHSVQYARIYSYINGNWFFYNTGLAYNYISYPINRRYDSDSKLFTEFKVAPYIHINAGNGAMIFNEDENRFMVQRINNISVTDLINTTKTICAYNISEEDNDSFSFNNPDYKLIYLGSQVDAGINAPPGFAIVKNAATNKYEILHFQIVSYGTSVTKGNWVTFDFSTAPGLEDATFFAYRNNSDYLYYGTEDKLHRLLISGSGVVHTDITNQVTDGTYTKISMMKFVLPRGIGKSLYVCTYDPTGQIGENGKITCYDIEDGTSSSSNTGDLKISQHSYKINPDDDNTDKVYYDLVFTGIGKVIDVTYK